MTFVDRGIVTVDMKPLLALVALSEEESLAAYSSLIESDLNRHIANLEAAVPLPTNKERAGAFHGIYQVAASFGMTSLLELTSILQEKNNSESSVIDYHDLDGIKDVIRQSLRIINEHASEPMNRP